MPMLQTIPHLRATTILSELQCRHPGLDEGILPRAIAPGSPEVTNRCNLLCTTCPRTYEGLEPPASSQRTQQSHLDNSAVSSRVPCIVAPKASSRVALVQCSLRFDNLSPLWSPQSDRLWSAEQIDS